MTLQQLLYFLEMADTQRYTRAAEKLNISPPSLSYAIIQLNKTLGVPLFTIDGTSISITEFGKAFLPYVESAFNILAQGEMQVYILISYICIEFFNQLGN